ncbi:MAG: type II secretion system protein [Phycisphaerales bacterium]|nr:MAG: type II secretion system protein [Phycisphaerales bacterium]
MDVSLRTRKAACGEPWWLRARQGKACLGFTLVELLVVIAVIALLLSILTPSLMKAKSVATRVRCAHNLKQIHLAMGLYLNANDNTYPCAQDPVSTDPPYWLWMGRGWRRFAEPYLDGTGATDANNPSVLLCPQDRTDPATYESTSYAYSMVFYHSPEQIDGMSATTDTYANPQPSIPQRSSDVAHPSGKILIGEWFSNHHRIEDEKGWWNWQGARNFIFAAGQVSFLKATQIRPARDELPDANLTVHGIKGQDHP